jgi:drug/metabolite transporter (DMT)-like permease
VAFAVFLGEQLNEFTGLGLAFIFVGLVVLLFATVRGEFDRATALLGLATALVWSVGEAFMKLGVSGTSSLNATYVALLTGTVAYLGVTTPVIYRHVSPRRAFREGWMLPFAGHGVLSFGIAYTAFFTSIQIIGLAQTALVTASWPILAIAFNYVVDRLRGRPATTEIEFKYLLPASVLLVTGSLVAAV